MRGVGGAGGHDHGGSQRGFASESRWSRHSVALRERDHLGDVCLGAKIDRIPRYDSVRVGTASGVDESTGDMALGCPSDAAGYGLVGDGFGSDSSPDTNDELGFPGRLAGLALGHGRGLIGPGSIELVHRAAGRELPHSLRRPEYAPGADHDSRSHGSRS